MFISVMVKIFSLGERLSPREMENSSFRRVKIFLLLHQSKSMSMISICLLNEIPELHVHKCLKLLVESNAKLHAQQIGNFYPISRDYNQLIKVSSITWKRYHSNTIF
jgi:hypothetical protein